MNEVNCGWYKDTNGRDILYLGKGTFEKASTSAFPHPLSEA